MLHAPHQSQYDAAAMVTGGQRRCNCKKTRVNPIMEAFCSETRGGGVVEGHTPVTSCREELIDLDADG